MSNISENLDLIINARYGKDVRQAIYEAIKDCYEDGKTGSTDLEARQKIDQLLANRSTILKNGENIIFQRFTSDDVSMSMANTVAGIVSSLSDPYDPSSTYKKGSFVYYDNFIWVCSQNISVPEDFNREHWGKVTVTRAISTSVAGMIAIGNDGENLEFKDTRLTYISSDENLTIINPTDEEQMTYIVIKNNYEDLTMYVEMGGEGGGHHGSDVVITPVYEDGKTIAEYTIDGILGEIKMELSDVSLIITEEEYNKLSEEEQKDGRTYFALIEGTNTGHIYKNGIMFGGAPSSDSGLDWVDQASISRKASEYEWPFDPTPYFVDYTRPELPFSQFKLPEEKPFFSKTGYIVKRYLRYDSEMVYVVTAFNADEYGIGIGTAGGAIYTSSVIELKDITPTTKFVFGTRYTLKPGDPDDIANAVWTKIDAPYGYRVQFSDACFLSSNAYMWLMDYYTPNMYFDKQINPNYGIGEYYTKKESDARFEELGVEITSAAYHQLEESGKINPNINYYVTDEEDTIKAITSSTDATKFIRFGQDSEGNWGYIPDGADTVIPFKSGGEKELVESIPILTSNTSSSKVSLSASSEYTGDYAAWKVADGNYETLWGTSDASTNAWIQFSYSSPTCIKKLYVVHREQRCVAKKFKLQVLNGSNWLDVGEFENEVGDIEQTFTINNPNKYSNYRILITENGGSGNGFRTIQLYEESSEASEVPWTHIGYFNAADIDVIDLNPYDDGDLEFLSPFDSVYLFYCILHIKNHIVVGAARIIYNKDNVLYGWWGGDISGLGWSQSDNKLHIAAGLVGDHYKRFISKTVYSLPPEPVSSREWKIGIYFSGGQKSEDIYLKEGEMLYYVTRYANNASSFKAVYFPGSSTIGRSIINDVSKTTAFGYGVYSMPQIPNIEQIDGNPYHVRMYGTNDVTFYKVSSEILLSATIDKIPTYTELVNELQGGS